MNERIKQLATEVGISVEYLTNTKQWVLIEALAESIVRECEALCYATARGRDAEAIAEAILEHFEVEP